MSAQLDEASIAAYLRGDLRPAARAEIEAALDQSPEWLAVVAALADESPPPTSRLGPPSEHNTDYVAALERAPILAVGTRVGRFEVRGKIAAGGMGVVYSAYDAQLRRSVALKLARHRPRDKDARDRLLGEARTLAQLSHPNVVAIYDVGTHDGRLFLAMEQLEGPTLAAILREGARDWRSIVDLFIQAAQGLEAAHRKGIVHRDFKPHNAIVEGSRVVVIDFGLAAAPSLLAGESVDIGPLATVSKVGGTPAYMAPEQRRGEPVTARSDQYSLAVALHQALFGVLPGIDRGSPLPHRIPRRLHRTILRALAPAPADRFPDLTAMIRALASARRRRWPWIAAGATASVGAVALALTAFAAGARAQLEEDPMARCENARHGLREVWNETRKAQLKLRFDSFERPYLSALGGKVSAAVDAYADRWHDANEASCQSEHRGERNGPMLALERRCLQGLRARLNGLLSALRDADVELAAHSLEGLGELPRPRLCADVERLREQDAAPAGTGAQAEIEAIEVALTGVQLLHRARHLEDARSQAKALVERALALGHAPTIAETRAELAWIHSTAGDQAQARAEIDRALLAAERGHHDRLLTITWIRRIWIAYEDGAPAEGRQAAAHADAWLTRISDPPELRYDYEQHLGWLEERAGEPTTSLEHFHTALALAEQAQLGPRERALADNGIGSAMLAQGDLAAAEESFERASQRLSAALGPEHPDVAKIRNNVASLRRAQGDLDGAEEIFGECLRVFQAAYGDGHELVAQVTLNLGTLALDRGHFAEALEILDRGMTLLEASLPQDHPMLAIAIAHRATALGHLERHEEAHLLYLDALERERAAYGDDYPGLANIEHDLALNLDRSGRRTDAVEHYRRAMQIIERAYGPEHGHISTISTNLAIALDGLDDPEEARLLHVRAVDLAGPLTLGEALTRYAEHLLTAGEIGEALATLDRAQEAHRETPTDAVMAVQTSFLQAKAHNAAAQSAAAGIERERHTDASREFADEAMRRFAELDEPELAQEVRTWIAERSAMHRQR